ncbi:hypothetical protein NW768_001830 [Fusarium equiseti]|uniref:Zn(2)-C6 fungal-type domain-containing protein n=1 Tax=Fusarium equiseti TaxID=61235 RepID=A0ABQ8RRY0_FUSEQ|nr:hypothetical protein NW768_001830 [Fusarium equiseti]
MATNSNTLPQGFSVYQPALGAQLQFFPAIGTRELDELVNAYIPGPASTQEKRATISLNYLEYAHLTGQTYKFYPVYTLSVSVESPVGASPLQDSGYGSFNTSPVTSNWDWTHVNTASSRRSSPKSTVSQQPTDFSNLPGMKIMTKDGRDVTNSASRGSKTKEQRDHAHLMRIIKACESCKKKKIRCDPSHKKRGVSSTAAQPAKVTKKTKTLIPEVKAPVVTPGAFAGQMAVPELDFPTNPENLSVSAGSESEMWEQFIQYPAVDDSYDFFNDPEGYFSPQSSSSVSEYSAKLATPTTDEDILRRPRGTTDVEIAELGDSAAYLPFNQADANHDYVDFNLYSPESSFSEDERMVPIQVSKQSVSLPRSPAPNPLPPRDSSGLSNPGDEYGDGQLTDNLFGGQLVPGSSAPQHLAIHDQLGQQDVSRDPSAGLGHPTAVAPTSSLSSDLLSTTDPSLHYSPVVAPDTQSSVETLLSTNSNVTISRDIIEARGVTTTGPSNSRLAENATTQSPSQPIEITATQQSSQSSATVAAQTEPQLTETTSALPVRRPMETLSPSRLPAYRTVDVQDALDQIDSGDAEIHNVAADIFQASPMPVAGPHASPSLTSVTRQPELESIAAFAAMSIAPNVWSYALQLLVSLGDCSEQWKRSSAQTQRKVGHFTSNLGMITSKLRNTILGGKTPVSRTLSMRASLIAV